MRGKEQQKNAWKGQEWDQVNASKISPLKEACMGRNEQQNQGNVKDEDPHGFCKNRLFRIINFPWALLQEIQPCLTSPRLVVGSFM